MNTATAITTAARRIARDANATPATVTRYYAADGRAVHHTIPHVLKLAGRRGTSAAMPGGGRMTTREAQDRLDAAAYAGPDDFAGERAGYYLRALESAREMAAR